MKTTISLPDAVVREAERFARHAKKSRSRLYAEAISEYLSRHSPDEITASLNDVIVKVNGDDSRFVKQAAKQAISHVEW
jgi:metal-responsive CopG/Arc/MetJ family transcriptional regulator